MGTIKEIQVPDIGDFKDIPVIEVLVNPGDRVAKEESLVTLESDKATLEVPSPYDGVVRELKVKIGDKVSEGSSIVFLEINEGADGAVSGTLPMTGQTATVGTSAPETVTAPQPALTSTETLKDRTDPAPAPVPAPAPGPTLRPPPLPSVPVDESTFSLAHASPSVRRFARELGVGLGKVKGTGPKGRILKEDVQSFVKVSLAQPRAPSGGIGLAVLEMPRIDFSKFGPVESRALSRIKKISGANLHRNWVTIPHVTQHEEADITDLEAFRKAMAEESSKQKVKLTLLGFLMKACVTVLQRHPEFNASLNPEGDTLILKKYYHIGVAVDTPEGLVVPVIRNVDQKGILQLARELGEVSARAREQKLAPADMQGGCFSISSLGGIGGAAFTPIINAPEVAILGVSRATFKPVYKDGAFVPRLMLPLSLSYDHRVIDGASGARFITDLAAVLGDVRRILL